MVKGREVFENILNSHEIDTGDQAIQVAVDEFSKQFNGDKETTRLFKITLQRELSGLVGIRSVKSKVKVLQRLWEIESRALIQTQKRKRIITLRLTEEEYNYLVTKAKERGITLSQYIRNKLGFND